MKWIEPVIYQPSAEIQTEYSNTLLLAGQLAKRGITTLPQARQFLDPEAYTLSSPFEFPDMRKAVARIQASIQNHDQIGIWGDFDVDGQTSTALLVSGLRALGARVKYHVPVRANESHGIGLEFLKVFIQKGIKLLITCDTGITEFESLSHLKDVGVDVILTDHHTMGESLPPALSIINPRLLPEIHPLAGLAGVGTAFQVLRGLLEENQETALSEDFYDLVALGTIADLAPLIGENRYYAKKGLDQMNQSPRPAISAMLDFAGIKTQLITESIIGFTLGPRLNAAGRLSDANPMVDFLISTDKEFIRNTAIQLEDLNSQRRLAVDMVFKSSLDMLEQQPALLQYPVIILAKSGWEGGVVGIAASRLVEKYGKPAILCNLRGEIAAGSARSVEGIDIMRAIRENSELLLRYGGHPMAAGLSIREKDIPDFRERLSLSVDQQAAGVRIEPKLEIDAYLPFNALNPSILDEIDHLAPFGPENPAPLLVTQKVEITSESLIGKTIEHRRLELKDQQGGQSSALWWNSADASLPEGLFDVAYRAGRDTYKGGSGVILEWVDFKPVAVDRIDLKQTTSRYQIYDHRMDYDPLSILDPLQNDGQTIFWAEGFSYQFKQAVNRTMLTHTSKLAILTAPPSFRELRDALEYVSPKEVYLFSMEPPSDLLKEFLADVQKVVRVELNGGEAVISLFSMAAVLGQTNAIAYKGLKWYQLRGQLEISQSGDQVKITRVNNKISSEIETFSIELMNSLREIAAFRNYYRRADPTLLLS